MNIGVGRFRILEVVWGGGGRILNIVGGGEGKVQNIEYWGGGGAGRGGKLFDSCKLIGAPTPPISAK